MLKFLKTVHVGFGWRMNAGLITFWTDPESPREDSYSLHLLVHPYHWVFGGGPDEDLECLGASGSRWGFGPLFLACVLRGLR